MKTLSQNNKINITLLLSGIMIVVGIFAQVKEVYALGAVVFILALIAKAIRD